MLKIKYFEKNFTEKIKDIINSYNYYTDKCNYIIFDNFNDINILFENYLKVIIESSSHTTKFIILTNKINKVIEAIRSRCLCFRIPELNIYDKEIYIQKRNTTNIKQSEISELVKYDFTTIKRKIDTNYEDFNKIILEKILHFFHKPFNKNLVELKDLSYNIKNSLIDFTELSKQIIKHYMIQDISSTKIINY